MLRIDPKYVDAWNNMGIALAGLGRYEEAIQYYDKALQLKPNHAKTWKNKGNALKKLGKSEDAKRCFEEVKRLRR